MEFGNKMKTSVVIPAYNEANTINKTVCELETYMKSYMRNEKSEQWEIIIVNDGSTDNTIDILKKIEKEKPWLKVVDLVINCGRGKALRSGIVAATGDVVITLDADLSYAPYHIDRLVDKLQNEKADIVTASAYRRDGSVKNVPFNRLWLSKFGNKILSYMYGENLTVLTCIVRAYRRDFIQKIDLHSDDKDIHLEILYKAKILGAKIFEIPADLKWREEKLLTTEKKTRRRSTLKIKKTSSSHLFFALLNKPGLIYLFPAYILMFISVVIIIQCIFPISADMKMGISLYHAIRNSMLNATPSWLTMSMSFILSIQFFSLGFLTNQQKKNYEESYKTMHSILEELRKNK